MPTTHEGEEWVKIANLSNYMLAAYATPYEIIVDGVRLVALAAAKLFKTISEKGSELPFGRMSQMHLLYFLQLLVRQGYSVRFFADAIESAALEIDDEPNVSAEEKAYALFFLNVAYIDVKKTDNFDFMLERRKEALPMPLALALKHEAKKVKRTTLHRKQDKFVRRLLEANKPLSEHLENMYGMSINQLAKGERRSASRKRVSKRRRESRQ